MSGFRRYMSKSQRACDFCRNRRAACRIEESLPCRQCRLHSRECTFEESSAPRKPRRRDPQSTAADGALENVPRNSAAQQDMHSPELSIFLDNEGNYAAQLDLVPPSPVVREEERNLQLVLDANPVTTADPTTRDLGAGGDQQADDPIYAFEDAMIDGDGLHELFSELPIHMDANLEPHALYDALVGHFLGPTGEQDPNLLRRYRFGHNNEFWFKKLATRMTYGGADPTLWMLACQESGTGSDGGTAAGSFSQERESLEELVAPDVGARLIKLFMKMISPHFPIFSNETLPRPSDSPIYLLSAMYLLMDPFFSHDDYLCIQVVYDRPQPRRLFEIAWRSFNEHTHKASIGLIQTAILLLLSSPLDPLDPDVAFKWSLVGTLVSMSETMGLHLDPEKWNIPQHQIDLRRRLSWTVFALDTWFALSLGRPTRISKENWMLDRLEDVYLESSGLLTSPDDHSFALQFSKLTGLVNSILQRLFTLRASATMATNFRRVLETARPLLVDLSSWHNELPESSRFSRDGGTELTDAVPPPRRQLQLAYYAARISIIRALLRSFENPEVEFTLDAADVGEFREARQRCRAAAKTCLVSMVEFLSSLNGLDFEQFWPSWANAIFAMVPHMAMLLVVTSKEANEAGQYKSLLNRLRRVLRTQSRSFDPIRLAILRLDAHFWRGIDNVFNMDPQLGCSFEDLVEVPCSAQPD